MQACPHFAAREYLRRSLLLGIATPGSSLRSARRRSVSELRASACGGCGPRGFEKAANLPCKTIRHNFRAAESAKLKEPQPVKVSEMKMETKTNQN